MEKLIFLDIDGVLNPTYYMNCLFKMWQSSDKLIKRHDEYGQLFFPYNVEQLARIVKETGAGIVISSIWKFQGLKAMSEMWANRGLPGTFIGVTPNEHDVVHRGLAKDYNEVIRGMEIELWLALHNFKGKYVIIDDTDDMLPYQSQYFVHTKSNIGLTSLDADNAIQILNC